MATLNENEFCLHYDECPVCTSKHIKDKYYLKDFTVSECLKCSALFVKEILTKDYLNDYYQKIEGNFAYDDNNRQCIDHYYRKLRLEIEKIKPNKGRILDVGCSAGYFLDQMLGWERHGIEVSEEYGNKAKENKGNTIFIGSFEEYPVKDNYFDVITMQDVFDHFLDPYGNLKKCHAMLKPGGMIVIKVHNISCFYAKITGPSFYAMIPPSHLFYFNKKSLNIILKRAGFRLIKSRFIGQILQLRTVFYRLSRGEINTIFYKLYRLLEGKMLGKISIYKNLNDIITVFAVKDQIDSRRSEG